jgi:hypothetical protein
LKLKYDEPLSNFVFNFNLRRYAKALLREIHNIQNPGATTRAGAGAGAGGAGGGAQ